MRADSSQAYASARSRAERAPSGWRSRVLRLVSLGLMIFVVVTGGLWFALARSQSVPLDSLPVRGVRLGMGMEDARAAFTDGPAGRWSSPPGCCGTTLEWSRDDVHATETRWASFQFDRGLLVAIRVLSDASPPRAPHVDVTPAVVTEIRAGADGSTSTTVLARRSEAHRGEVKQLIAAGESSN